MRLVRVACHSLDAAAAADDAATFVSSFQCHLGSSKLSGFTEREEAHIVGKREDEARTGVRLRRVSAFTLCFFLNRAETRRDYSVIHNSVTVPRFSLNIFGFLLSRVLL